MSRASWMAATVCGLWAFGAIPAGWHNGSAATAARGQNFGQRTVSGTVLSGDLQPVAGATVFLKNQKTKAIRSFASLANGHFHFAQIDMSIDYDLWAEKEGKKSATKTVSSWDARKDFVADLRLK